MQIWFIGRTLASQAGKVGSTPIICFFYLSAKQYVHFLLIESNLSCRATQPPSTTFIGLPRAVACTINGFTVLSSAPPPVQSYMAKEYIVKNR